MAYSNKSVGTKAINLDLLSNNFTTPAFSVLNADDLDVYFDSIGLTRSYREKAFRGSTEQRIALRETIRANTFFFSSSTPHHGRKLIVRSSALGEDGEKHSFAGIFESKITSNTKKRLAETLTHLIAEAFSERVYWYAKQIGLASFPRLSFIIQEYIEAEYGGVAFSTTNYDGQKGMLIEAVEGSTEKAVLGRDVTKIFVTSTIPQSKIPSSIISQVVKVVKKVELFFKSPQDIEWCYANGVVYVLQSRPITKHIQEELIVWDNSNIAESYSGVVLPLTCSFAKFIYSKVYRDVARNSNIAESKITENSDLFDNLLGFHYGR